ncbi:hypothetical protein JNUCC64_14080 [Streptomyces sp. JNUCC 64]
MKIRPLAVLATTGTLALTAFSAPAAHADDRPATPAAGALPASTISGFALNGGEALVVGTSVKSFPVTFTAKHPDGVGTAAVLLWKGGASLAEARRVLGPDAFDHSCDPVDATTSKCAVKVYADPRFAAPEMPQDHLTDADAGRWNVAVVVEDGKQRVHYDEKFRTHSVKRAAKLTVDAAPGAVRTGANVTVKGDLTRASWNTHRYGGFPSAAVKLEFRPTGGQWTTVKTVSADSRGKVRTTVKASVDGHYRLAYGGARTTGGATSPADFVDVR